MDPDNTSAPTAGSGRIMLFWIPLGAGGNGFVRLNGRLYEAVKAWREHRPPLGLFHAALEVSVDGERFVIENAWPSPNADTASRGVVVEGPVFSRHLGRFRPFRYEVRSWHEGVIADANQAVAKPVLSHDPSQARRLLDFVPLVPTRTWGRDEADTGDMWNSNSVVAWLLAKGGLLTAAVQPPASGRAPGWVAGIRAAADSAAWMNWSSAGRQHPPDSLGRLPEGEES